MKSVAIALLLLSAYAAAGQVEIVEDRYDYQEAVFELTLRNNGSSVARLTELEEQTLYSSTMVPTSSGPRSPVTLKPAAQYRFADQSRINAEPVLEMQPGQLYKITVGIDFEYPSGAYYDYIGAVDLRFSGDTVVKTKPYRVTSGDLFNRNEHLTKDRLIQAIRSDTFTGYEHIYEMRFHTWNAAEALALLQPWINRPQAARVVVEIAGILGLTALTEFVRTNMLFNPVFRSSDPWEPPPGLPLRQLLGPSGAATAYAQLDSILAAGADAALTDEAAVPVFDCLKYLEFYHPDDATALLDSLFNQYAPRVHPGHATMTRLTQLLLSRRSELPVPHINRLLAGADDSRKLAVLTLMGKQGLFDEQDAANREHLEARYAGAVKSQLFSTNGAVRRLSLEVLSSVYSDTAVLIPLLRQGLLDPDEKVRLAAANLVRRQKVNTLAPDLLRNFGRSVSPEEAVAYHRTLFEFGAKRDSELVNIIIYFLGQGPDSIDAASIGESLTHSHANPGRFIDRFKDFLKKHRAWSAAAATAKQAERLAAVVALLLVYDKDKSTTPNYLNDVLITATHPVFIGRVAKTLIEKERSVDKSVFDRLGPALKKWTTAADTNLRYDAFYLCARVTMNEGERLDLLGRGLADASERIRASAAEQAGLFRITELKSQLQRQYEAAGRRGYGLRVALARLGDRPAFGELADELADLALDEEGYAVRNSVLHDADTLLFGEVLQRIIAAHRPWSAAPASPQQGERLAALAESLFDLNDISGCTFLNELLLQAEGRYFIDKFLETRGGTWWSEPPRCLAVLKPAMMRFAGHVEKSVRKTAFYLLRMIDLDPAERTALARAGLADESKQIQSTALAWVDEFKLSEMHNELRQRYNQSGQPEFLLRKALVSLGDTAVVAEVLGELLDLDRAKPEVTRAAFALRRADTALLARHLRVLLREKQAWGDAQATEAQSLRLAQLAYLLFLQRNAGDSAALNALVAGVRNHDFLRYFLSVTQREDTDLRTLKPALMRLIQNDDPEIRESAWLALYNAGMTRSETIAAVRVGLQDSEETIREYALEVIEEERLTEFKEAVRALYKKSDGEDKDALRRVLVSLGGRVD